MPTKNLLFSKTIIGVVVSALASLLNFCHVNISDLIPAINDAVGADINATLTTAGVVFAIYGRVQAELVHRKQLAAVTAAVTSPTGATPLSSEAPSTLAPVDKYVKALVGLAVIGGALVLSGCAGTTTTATTASGSVPVSTQLVNVGYEIENFLQEFNTGLSATAPSAETFLTQTHNSGDAATVALYSTLLSEATSAATAALKAGLPPQQVQAAVNSTLAPSNAVAAAAAVTTTTGSN